MKPGKWLLMAMSLFDVSCCIFFPRALWKSAILDSWPTKIKSKPFRFLENWSIRRQYSREKSKKRSRKWCCDWLTWILHAVRNARKEKWYWSKSCQNRIGFYPNCSLCVGFITEKVPSGRKGRRLSKVSFFESQPLNLGAFMTKITSQLSFNPLNTNSIMFALAGSFHKIVPLKPIQSP